jgi:hypothetical protein
MEYESVTQKVLLSIESILQDAKQLQHAHLSWLVSILFSCFRFENIGHGNRDNNLESPSTSKNPWDECMLSKWHIC